jgi:tRNA (cmo5U34)-methyltransferase
MNSSLNRFNSLAWIYDTLARVIFGKSIKNAQVCYLKEIPKGCNVLILGGGTGWIIRKLLQINPGVNIWYIEASSAMIQRARKKVAKFHKDRIHFIHGTEDSVPTEINYNAVITPFFLDLFSMTSLKEVIRKIRKTLTPDALWLATDFVDNHKWWQRVALRLMYLFFRIICGIESKELPAWENVLRESGCEELKSNYFFNTFIKATLFVMR